jgi:anti-sigma factor RsiW
MNPHDLEFQVSQYVDGQLDAAATAALEVRLRDDAAARSLLAEYKQVAAFVRDNSSLPAINWNRLAESISTNIDASEEQRIERRFRMPWIQVAGSIAAVAACVVIGLFIFRSQEVTSPTKSNVAVARPRIAEISLAPAQLAAGPRVADVTIDMPNDDTALAAMVWDELQPRNSRIVVTAGAPAVMPDALLGH